MSLILEKTSFSIGGRSYEIIDGGWVAQHLRESVQSFISIITSLRGTPYLWGGQNGYGADCSGFVQSVSRIFGKRFPRNSSQQAQMGTGVSQESARTGDLALFGRKTGGVSHLGFLLRDRGDNSLNLVHGKQFVKVNELNEDGMFAESADSREPKGIRHVFNL